MARNWLENGQRRKKIGCKEGGAKQGPRGLDQYTTPSLGCLLMGSYAPTFPLQGDSTNVPSLVPNTSSLTPSSVAWQEGVRGVGCGV